MTSFSKVLRSRGCVDAIRIIKNTKEIRIMYKFQTTFCTIQYMINEMRRRQWPFAKTFSDKKPLRKLKGCTRRRTVSKSF